MEALTYLLRIFINGALLLGSIFVGSKAWNLLNNINSGLDTLKYIGWLIVFMVLINLLTMKR